MSVLFFYTPTVLFGLASAVFGLIAGEPPLLWLMWTALLALSGWLLDHRLVWGCLPQLACAGHLLALGSRYTGQVLFIELLLGLALAAHALACALYVHRRKEGPHDP